MPSQSSSIVSSKNFAVSSKSQTVSYSLVAPSTSSTVQSKYSARYGSYNNSSSTFASSVHSTLHDSSVSLPSSRHPYNNYTLKSLDFTYSPSGFSTILKRSSSTRTIKASTITLATHSPSDLSNDGIINRSSNNQNDISLDNRPSQPVSSLDVYLNDNLDQSSSNSGTNSGSTSNIDSGSKASSGSGSDSSSNPGSNSGIDTDSHTGSITGARPNVDSEGISSIAGNNGGESTTVRLQEPSGPKSVASKPALSLQQQGQSTDTAANVLNAAVQSENGSSIGFTNFTTLLTPLSICLLI